MNNLSIADLASEIVDREVEYIKEYSPYDLENYYREHRFDDLIGRLIDEVQVIYNIWGEEE